MATIGDSMSQKEPKKKNLPHQKSLQSATKYMFENKVDCDVTLDVRGVIIPAHKFILIARSPVFSRMFLGCEGGFVEAKSNTVVIKDDHVNSDAVKEMLRYMYYGEIQVNSTNVMFVIYLANKYMITRLITRCSNYIFRNTNVAQIIFVLQNSLEMKIRQLVEKCHSYIGKHFKEALDSDAFMDAEVKTVKSIASIERMEISETYLFEKCYEWAANKCRTADKKFDKPLLKSFLAKIMLKIRVCFLDPQVIFRRMAPLFRTGFQSTDSELFAALSVAVQHTSRRLPLQPVKATSKYRLIRLRIPMYQVNRRSKSHYLSSQYCRNRRPATHKKRRRRRYIRQGDVVARYENYQNGQPAQN